MKLLKTVPGFFLNLYKGEVPLVITFWVFFILLGWYPILLSWLLAFLWGIQELEVNPVFGLLWLLFILVATWTGFYLNLYKGEVTIAVTCCILLHLLLFWLPELLLDSAFEDISEFAESLESEEIMEFEWTMAIVVLDLALYMSWLLFISVATSNSASRHKNRAMVIPVQILAAIAQVVAGILLLAILIFFVMGIFS